MRNSLWTKIFPSISRDTGFKNTSEQSGKSTSDWWPFKNTFNALSRSLIKLFWLSVL